MNKNWIEFLDKVNKAISSLRSDQCDMPFFRGHAQASFKLIPTLFRNKNVDLQYVETSLFYDFVSMAGSKLKNEDSWEILFNMRHHGVPTRLLDWTTSFATALFFSINAPQRTSPHIWILNPYLLGEKNPELPSGLLNPYYDLENDYVKLFVNTSQHPDVVRPQFPMVFYPPRNNSRIFAQQGVFTVHGTITKI